MSKSHPHSPAKNQTTAPTTSLPTSIHTSNTDMQGTLECVCTMYLHVVVESCQGLNEHVCSLVRELVAPSCEEVQGFVQVKVIVSEKKKHQHQPLSVIKFHSKIQNKNTFTFSSQVSIFRQVQRLLKVLGSVTSLMLLKSEFNEKKWRRKLIWKSYMTTQIWIFLTTHSL